MKKKMIRRMVAIILSINMLMATPIISFAKEISPKEDEVTTKDYTVGQVITRLEGTASGTGTKIQGFYIERPMTISAILLGKTRDGNGFVRFRLYSAESNKPLLEKDFYQNASATANHLYVLPGRYSLEVGCSTGGEYAYTGTVMVYQL